MRSIIILFLLILFTGCAKNPSEKTDEAIDIALTYLSSNNCDGAIDVLEKAGRDRKNAVYLQVLASAYACRAGFNEITFLSTDIPKIDSSAAGMMKSLTTFTLSHESEADSDEYLDLTEALDILLYVDSDQPSQTAREAKYGPRKAGDMGMQALILSFTQLGKFLNFYGNVDALGNKGGGAANTEEQGATASTCFLEYTEAQAVAFLLGGGGGVCNNMALDDGHPDLSLAAPDLETTKRRMCEGLMLVTNIIDILENITLPNSSTFTKFGTVSTTVSTIKSDLTTNFSHLAPLLDTTSQADCEVLLDTPAQLDNMQQLFALLFEKGLP